MPSKLISINLSKKEIKVRNLESDESYFMGGKGLGFKLFEKFKPGITFIAGPLTGLKLSGMARAIAVFKSPATGFIAESSCGGFFGPELRKVGYSAIMVHGRSDSPVLLKIQDENISIEEAGWLWGKNTFDTEDLIKKEYGRKFKIACIGQAGENLIKFACIEHAKGREFGRCGGGAVMGLMRLKAIAISGSGDIESEIANPKRFQEIKEEFERRMIEGLRGLTKTGTARMLSIVNEAGALPTRNWKDGEFEFVEKILNDLEKIHKRNRTCYSCKIACGKISKFNEKEVDGPEYETLFSFGSLCNINDVKAISEFNLLCDKFGMDTISAGNVISSYLHSIGIKGDKNSISELIMKIAMREGIGDRLAEGIKEFSRIHVKGLELPGYDPRALYGMALGYATCYRGGCHIKHVMHRPNLTGEVDRFETEGQAKLLIELEDFYGLTDSLVICRFVTLPKGVLNIKDVSELYNAVTGKDLKPAELMRKGKEIIELSRNINKSFGLKIEDDSLPEFFFREGIGNGNSKGQIIKKEDFKQMIREYYMLRGW